MASKTKTEPGAGGDGIPRLRFVVRKKGLYMSKLKATLVIVIGALAIGGTVYFKNRNDALDKLLKIMTFEYGCLIF